MATFLEILLPSFQRHLAYAKLLHCLPFEWDDAQRRIIVKEATSRRISIWIWATFQTVYVSLQMSILVLSFHRGFAMTDLLAAALILALHICCCIVRMDPESDSTPIEIINQLIS